jgi:hypothetical protein
MIGIAGPAPAQAPVQPTNAGPVQPWGLPPLPTGVGPVEKFADIHDTQQGQFLEGGSFDTQGNLWFVRGGDQRHVLEIQGAVPRPIGPGGVRLPAQ